MSSVDLRNLVEKIITSPSAALMKDMVTKGFYNDSFIGLWLFEVIGREFDDMAKWARELRYEAFPQTCTWSLPIWEFVSGIEPDETLSLEFRRSRLLAQRWSHPPVNPARIEAVLSNLTGLPVEIIDPTGPYTFQVIVDIDKDIHDFREALTKLRIIKPSHLSFDFYNRLIVDYFVTDYTAGAISEFLRESFVSED